MIEKSLIKNTSKKFWAWIIALLAVIAVGFAAYIYQMTEGFAVTGMSRDVSWGMYIGHFTFFVGVAAGGVMLVLPYYLHDVKEFGRITVIGEFLAVAAICMCLLFIVADIGSPMKALNMFLHPTPNSPLFWDATVLMTYLVINIVVGWQVLQAENKGIKYKKWVRALAIFSIPFAFSIHTVTAFLYSGLPGRHYFLTAMLAPKFLASAFATGPALIIIICYILKSLTGFDAGQKAINKLSTISIYGFLATIFMVMCEFFTAFFSQIPGHMATLQYLFFGYHGHSKWVPFMWVFVACVITAIAIMVPRKTRENPTTLVIGCIAIFLAMYIEKGLTFVIGGLAETPFGTLVEYNPTAPEIMIIVAVFAVGALVASLLFKIVVSVKKDADLDAFPNKK